MCGIAGIMRFDDRPIAETAITKMRDSLAHRGPDGFGIFLDANIAFGHRRLSIIDLTENAKQPFTSADGRYTITFNGEIYNYKEFIPELEAKGVKFRSSSDTEVLLYLYIIYGPEMLNRLNGMWAFGIWDNQERKLFLCRDRMGVKPLYYSNWDNTLYFASEPKALFTAGVPLKLDESLFYELFIYRYIAGANTLFKDVFKLLPGHYMFVDSNGKKETTRYWHLGEIAARTKVEGDPYKWFEDRFNTSIRYRMVSDAPVGVLLSGGLDSSCVAASLANQGYKGINTFTIKFLEANLNEAHLAEKLAKNLDYKSHSLLVEGDLLFDSLVKSIWAHDEPLIHQNDPQLVAIANYSKQYVKVLLSGEGADELMAGYVRYKPLKYWGQLKAFKAFLKLPIIRNKERIKKLNRYIHNRSIDDAILLNASNFFPDEFGLSADKNDISYRKEMLNEARKYVGNDPVKVALYLDQHTYMESLLMRNDRTTMIAGIECREPYLDYKLVEGLTTLPISLFTKGKKGKNILLESVGKSLPEEIRNFKKVGLGVPWERYLREHSRCRKVLESIKDSKVLKMGMFAKLEKEKTIAGFLAGDNSQKLLVRFFFMMHLWEIEYLSKF
jgi:asparagine synthase (glutamine-hydrolysing)